MFIMKSIEKAFLQETFDEVLNSVNEDYQFAISGNFLTDKFVEQFEAKANFLIDMANKRQIDLKLPIH